MFGFNHIWLIVILIVVLIIFGPGKLPQIGGAVGTAIKEFRKATSELKDEVTRSTAVEPAAPPATAASEPAPGVVVTDPAHKDAPQLPKA